MYLYEHEAKRHDTGFVTYIHGDASKTASNWLHCKISNSECFLMCVCKYSRLRNSFLSSRREIFKSVKSRYFISECGASTKQRQRTVVASHCLELSPSLSHYFSLLYYPFPPALFRFSSCMLSLRFPSLPFLFYGRGIFPQFELDPLQFLPFDMHCHYFLVHAFAGLHLRYC